MQLTNTSPLYQCQAKDKDGQQCTRQSTGYRRYNGELYFACIDHIRDKTYTPIHVQPDTPRIWPNGHTNRGTQPRG